MYITATSTSYITLQNDVNHLWDAFNWTVGGIGISVAVVIILLVWFQNREFKSLTREEIDKLKSVFKAQQEELRDEVQKQFTSRLDQVYSQLRDELSVQVTNIKDEIGASKKDVVKTMEDLEVRFKKTADEARGDIARSFAIGTMEKGQYAYAFNWLLTAVSSYIESGYDSTITNNCLNSALNALKKIDFSDEDAKKYFVEKIDHNNKLLDAIERTYPGQTKLIRSLFDEKLKHL